MSNVAANSIFARKDQLNLFMSMYLAEWHSNGAGASQPNAWGPPVLAPPRMRSMSRRNLCAKSRQALPGTDDGASQPANPSKAAEQQREEWPGLWRLTLEWRKIVVSSYSVQAFPCRKRQCTQTSIQTCIPTGSTQRSRGKRKCRFRGFTTNEPTRDDRGPREPAVPISSVADEKCRPCSPWRQWKPTGTAHLPRSGVPVGAMRKRARKGEYDPIEIKARNVAAEAWDKRYYANLQAQLKQRGSSEEAKRTASDAVTEIRN